MTALAAVIVLTGFAGYVTLVAFALLFDWAADGVSG